MKSTSFAIAATLLIVGIGCQRPTPAPVAVPIAETPKPEVVQTRIEPGSEASYFPMESGDRWTFNYFTGDGQNGLGNPEVLEVRVEGNRHTVNGTEGDLLLLFNGQPYDRQTWLMDDAGLYLVSQGLKGVKFSTPQTVAQFPLKVGQQFTWEGTGILPTGTVGKMRVLSTVMPAENVDTEIGSQRALPIESRTTFTVKGAKGMSISTIYLKPQIGIVRFRTEIHIDKSKVVQLLKLKNHTLKTK